MDDRPDPSEWLTERTGLSLLALASAVLAALVLLPYLQYIVLGAILAYVLAPLQRRLEPVVGSMIAALALVGVAVLAILLPTLYVLAIAIREAVEVITAIQEGTVGLGDLERRLEETGHVVDIGDLYETYQEPIESTLQGLATSGIEIVGGLPGLLIGLTVTLFVLFALLRDGDRLVAWIELVMPIDDDIQRELRIELNRLMWASLVGNVAVAAIQAVALGVGLALLDVPAVVLLTVVTFVFALLPLVGAFGVWLPISLFLLATGAFLPAAALAVYGSIVSASDTYLRPALIGRSSAFNAAVIVVGIFGGIVVFGAVGLFIGPVVLGGAKVTLDVFAREQARETGPGPAPDHDEADEVAGEMEPDTGIGPGADRGSDDEAHETEERGDEADETEGPDDDGRSDREADDVSETNDSNSGTDARPGPESDGDESTRG